MTPYDVQCVVEAHKIKKRSEYHYHGQVPGNPDQYSRGFVEWMVRQYRQDSTFFSDARDKAKLLRARARARAAAKD